MLFLIDVCLKTTLTWSLECALTLRGESWFTRICLGHYNRHRSQSGVTLSEFGWIMAGLSGLSVLFPSSLIIMGQVHNTILMKAVAHVYYQASHRVIFDQIGPELLLPPFSGISLLNVELFTHFYFTSTEV